MKVEHVVGGEIVSWCTKCKLILGHTIVALVEALPKKVKCNTCNGNHNYREKAPKPRKSITPKKGTPVVQATFLTRLNDDYDFSQAGRYTIGESYKADQVINHPNFGVGLVVLIIDRTKIDVLFKGGTKRLVQNLKK
ncbi:hypothetical protein JYT92_00020 [bacterium AH-315-L15]|nr:hypothetical protein [bacterium AH-315-L15]